MSSGPWWRIAWRNLGRNARRSFFTASALALGYVAAVIMVGLSEGLTAEMIENGTDLVTGQLQVHATDYLPDREIYQTIGGDAGADVGRLVRTVESDPEVTGAAPRVYGSGLVSSGANTTAGILMGIDSDLEPHVGRLLRSVERGRAPAPGTRELLIGAEMARRLNATPGDTLVLVAPAADGSLGNDLYVVSGIFRTGLNELDASYAVLPIRSLQTLLALAPNQVHEIAAVIADPWQAPAVRQRLAPKLRATGLDLSIEPWTELRPEMVDYARLAGSANWLIIIIVFAMAIFGVANTMLMGTFERRREFAVLMALGTTPPAIVRTVVYEAIVLGLLSLAAGVAVAVPLSFWWHHAPPDLSWLYGGFTMAGALVRPVLRVEYAPAFAVWAGLALLLTAVLAALYPAVKAARVPPADALSGV